MTKQRKAVKGELHTFGDMSITYSLAISRYMAEATFMFDKNDNLELSLTPDIENTDTSHTELEIIGSVNERSIAIANKNGWLAFQHDELMNLFVRSDLIHIRAKNGTSIYMRLAEEVKKYDPESINQI